MFFIQLVLSNSDFCSFNTGFQGILSKVKWCFTEYTSYTKRKTKSHREREVQTAQPKEKKPLKEPTFISKLAWQYHIDTGWWFSMYWTWLVSQVNGWLYGWGQRRHIYGRFHSLPATYSTLLLLPSCAISCGLMTKAKLNITHTKKTKICFRLYFLLHIVHIYLYIILTIQPTVFMTSMWMMLWWWN